MTEGRVPSPKDAGNEWLAKAEPVHQPSGNSLRCRRCCKPWPCPWTRKGMS